MARHSPERIDGPTPNGGAYAIAYYRDDGSREIVEFDANDIALDREMLVREKAAAMNTSIMEAGFIMAIELGEIDGDVIITDEDGVEIKRPPPSYV
jgi:hypothetical protein